MYHLPCARRFLKGPESSNPLTWCSHAPCVTSGQVNIITKICEPGFPGGVACPSSQ